MSPCHPSVYVTVMLSLHLVSIIHMPFALGQFTRSLYLINKLNAVFNTITVSNV